MKQSKNSSTFIIVILDIQWYLKQSKTSLWCKKKKKLIIYEEVNNEIISFST